MTKDTDTTKSSAKIDDRWKNDNENHANRRYESGDHERNDNLGPAAFTTTKIGEVSQTHAVIHGIGTRDSGILPDDESYAK